MSFIWDGVSSDTMKFNVTSRQVYNAPAYDLNAIEVPGRSGDLLNPQNRFKNKQISYTGFLKASDFEGSTWREKLSTGLIQLKGWLCSDAGTYHELTDDYDPGFTRYGYISGETAISDVQDRPFGVTLTVTFNCKPFMYKAGEPMELPETKSASGSIITITDGAENTPLKSCVVNIEPVQDLHGYDYPWPAGGGKNLLPDKFYSGGNYNRSAGTTFSLAEVQDVTKTGDDYSKIDSAWNGLSMLSNPLEAGTYRVSITYSATSGTRSTLYVLDENLTVTRVIANSSIDGAWTNSITLSETEKYIFVWVGSNTAATLTISKPMITAGSSLETFAPYSNISPISGWTQVKVTRTGANLLPLRSGSTTQNGQTFTPSNGTLVIDGTATANSALYLKDGTIEGNKIYLPAGTYEVSGFEDYNDANTYVGVNINSTSGAYTATSKSGSHTFTVEAGDYVFPRARIASGAVMTNYVLRPMIRRVSDASAFAPYQGTERTISLGRTVYGGTLDVVRGKLNAKPYYASYSGQALVGPWISSHDKYVAGATPTTGAQVVDMGAAGTDYDVTPQTIKTLKGINSIWADAGSMEIEYPIPTENPYPFGSRPLYEITMAGTGTLVVNGKEWTITDYTGTLYCDTEAMEWYDASQLRNSIVSGDGWPVFEAGENSVSYTGDITKVMVTPRWRTL